VLARGRAPRRRFADLMIAATALAEQLPLVTRDAADFAGFEDLVDVIEV
jgi:predicted nucleic acid-binding protein